MSAQEVIETLWGYAAVFGVAVVGLSAWVGRIVAERITLKARARIESEVREHMDALSRRRDVYSRLATGMRVFHQATVPATAKDKQEFMAAYDQSCVWASESVIKSVGAFLDVMARSAYDQSPEAMKQKKDAYVACILEMRRDAGFPESDFQFRFVTFDK
jgi:hypothetical protein